MRKKLIILISLLLIISTIFTACVPDSDKNLNKETDTKIEPLTSIDDSEEKILRTNNANEPGSLDPALAQGTHESWVLNHTFEGLMKYDQDGKLAPAMAKKYELSDDDLTYIFTLKDDLKWSNGDPITAHDFEYAWKRALNPKLAANYASQLFYIEGAEAYNSIERPGKYKDPRDDTKEIVKKIIVGELDGLDIKGKDEEEINDMVFDNRLLVGLEEVAIDAIDDKTLKVTLTSPTGYFLELTAFYTYFPVNKAVVEGNENWAKNSDTHVSNGPFTLTEWRHDSSIKIRKNENYYDKDNINLDGIDFTIINDMNTTWQGYEGGEYDFLAELPQGVTAQMLETNNPELKVGKMLGSYYYNINTAVKPFNNVKVRKALSMTIDRETITSKITQGGQIPAQGVVPLGMNDENGEEYRDKLGQLVEYDLTKAKKLFQEGLEEEGMTNEEMKDLVILYNTNEGQKKIAEAIQEMWRKNLDIDLKLENVDFNIKLAREKVGDYNISRGGWMGDYVDPMTFIDLWWSESNFNDVKYNNPEYDKLILLAKSTADQDLRFDSMREAEKILMEDMPVIPIFFNTQPYVQKSYVSGIYKPLIDYPKLTYADMEK